MALRPKGAPRPSPAPDGYRVVQLVWPAWYPPAPDAEPVKHDKGARLTVPEGMAEAWEARGVAMAID